MNDIITEIEMGTTATQSWNVGDLFINFEGKLCQATETIDKKEKLILNKNIIYKNVPDIMAELKAYRSTKETNSLN